MGFTDKLRHAWKLSGSMLSVGLDPDPRELPTGDDAFAFCRDIVEATADLVCAFKPQFAHFAARGAEADLERVIAHVRDRHPDVVVILDAKRGDIGSTAEHYATEAFVRYGADAVTVNPYLGGDTIEPFLAHDGKGVIVLCRTSNPGSGDFQSLTVDGEPLYLHVARRVAGEWSQRGECGLVVGATYPDELRQVRAVVGDLPILLPGVGAQGGDIPATVAAGADSAGLGMIINSARGVIEASRGPDFADAARRVAMATRDAIRAAAPTCGQKPTTFRDS